jgi:hypothetical protein
MAGIIINNLIKEKTVTSQLSPLDSTVFAELQRATSSSHSCDSDQNLLFNILTLARFIGPRVSEYAQTTPDKVDYHVYPSGTRVIKAFTANNFVLRQKRPRPQENCRFITHLSRVRTDHLAHPEKPPKWPEDQTLCRYEEPCNMPHLGSTANGNESLPSCTTGQHAGCLLQNQESPVLIYHWQQDCYTPL